MWFKNDENGAKSLLKNGKWSEQASNERLRKSERYKVEMYKMYASFVWNRVVSGGLYILCVQQVNDDDDDGDGDGTQRDNLNICIHIIQNL